MTANNTNTPPLPWTAQYNQYWSRYNAFVLQHDGIRRCFRENQQLPVQYGVGLDERCIEFPWYFGKAAESAQRILDAGSALNYDFCVSHPYFTNRELTILTLSPEDNCFWRRKVSYMFSDLRDLPFKDGYFDEICCISTIEHVGLDNTRFTGQSNHYREYNVKDFEIALTELNRVLQPGGRLMVTVPFGRYENWGEFQQFDSELLDHAADAFGAITRDETYYFYTPAGWQYTPEKSQCSEMRYSSYAIQSEWGAKPTESTQEADEAVAAAAVACCIWTKSS